MEYILGVPGSAMNSIWGTRSGVQVRAAQDRDPDTGGREEFSLGGILPFSSRVTEAVAELEAELEAVKHGCCGVGPHPSGLSESPGPDWGPCLPTLACPGLALPLLLCQEGQLSLWHP